MAIQLSEAATKQVRELKRAQNLPDNVFLRMSVKGGVSLVDLDLDRV